MFDPDYSKFQNVFMGQHSNPMNVENFGQNISNPYIRGVTTHMPQPMPGNVTEPSLYPLQASLATPQFNSTPVQSYAEGGAVKSGKSKKGKNNAYSSIAEMIRQQGKGEDTILAHINPLEAMMLEQMGGSGTINPTTGLPQFGFLKGLRKVAAMPFKPFKAMMGRDSSVRNSSWVEPTPSASTDAIRYGENLTAPVANIPPPRQKSSNEEMFEKLQNQMYGDQSRLAGTNFVPYRGETVAPLSPMTMQAQNLKAQWAQKPTPYSNKIQTVLGRDAQGFSPDQQQNMLDMLRRGTTSQDFATQRLGKQFNNNYGYEPEREARLRGKIGTDIDRALVTSGGNINNLSQQLAMLEGRRNTGIVNAFQNAGLAKEGRRNALTNQLEEFGNQERNFRNLKNQASRDTFNEELAAPQAKLNTARQALQAISPFVSGPLEEMHPDKVSANNAQLQRISNYYNAPHQNYPGQRVVDIDPMTQQGYNLTQQFDPKYRDKFYNERKNLEQGFLNGPNLATQTYNNISPGLEPLMANLDYLTKQQLKQNTKEISGRHRRYGTYGSGVHKAETEKALRDILRRVQMERENSLLGVARNQGQLAAQNEQTNLNKYAQLVGLGAKDYSDVLNTHRNLVNTGNRQWVNKQEQENARLQNWYDQLNHEMPIRGNEQAAKRYMLNV